MNIHHNFRHHELKTQAYDQAKKLLLLSQPNRVKLKMTIGEMLSWDHISFSKKQHLNTKYEIDSKKDIHKK